MKSKIYLLAGVVAGSLLVSSASPPTRPRLSRPARPRVPRKLRSWDVYAPVILAVAVARSSLSPPPGGFNDDSTSPVPAS